jgi:hypothetical protein
MVSVLTINPDRCVVMALDMTRNPRIVREGKRWALHRYLHYRLIGVEVPREVALLPGGCTTRDCLNPHHRVLTFARGTFQRKACPNGHPYTPTNTSFGTRWKCRKCHEDWLARKRASTRRVGWCRNGHKMTKRNVYRWVDAKGTAHRRCRRCQLERQHAYRQRMKEN